MRFAFLIHSRNYKDIQYKFKITRFLPVFMINWFCFFWPPILVNKINYKSKSNITVKGYVIGIPMTARQILRHRKKACRKIISAIKKAGSLGAEIVSLGALTAPVTNGGLSIKDRVKPAITTGNALTAAVTIDHVEEFIEKHENISKISVIGATGSIGRVVTLLIAEQFPQKELYIFARTKENLDNLLKAVKQVNKNIKVCGFISDLEKVVKTDLVIVATSSSEALIHSRHLKKGAIVYDITQPQNVDKATLALRKDLEVYDGGLVEVPNIKSNFPFGLPPRIIFSCLGEVILLAIEGCKHDFVVGKTEVDQVKYIGALAKKHSFKSIKL